MTNDTQNALTDFNFCLALSQIAINSQMETAWKTWKRRQEFQDTIHIFKIQDEIQDEDNPPKFIDCDYGLQAQIAPLTVSLNVPDGKLGQVKVTLNLQSGKLVYFDKVNKKDKELEVKEWKISFITELDKKTVDLNALKIIDPDIHRTAEEAIKNSGLPDDVFSIEYLFLKFTEVDLLLSDNRSIDLPKNVPKSAREQALSSLNVLLQGELGDFMLGTVVRRNNQQATPTFALTDFIFHVHSDLSVPDASTLSYLGMLANQPMPADKDAARISLKDAWVRPEIIDGTKGLVSGIMAISKQVFMDKYLIPKFSKALEIQQKFPNSTRLSLNSTGLVYTFKWQTEKNTIEKESFPPSTWYDRSYKGFELQITINPCTIDLSGKVWSRRHIERYNDLRDNYRNWNVDVEGHTDISGSITLSGQNIGVKYEISFLLNYKFGEYNKDGEEVEGWAKIKKGTGEIGKFFHTTSTTIIEDVETEQRVLKDEIQTNLSEQLNNIQADINQHTFIPPGGGVFTFQNPRFSLAGDLLFDVLYQAP